jgi:hypothetical protein
VDIPRIIEALSSAVEKNGLTAVLILVIAAGAAFVAFWNSKLVKSNQDLVTRLARTANDIKTLATETVARNTVANDNNTASNLKVVASVDRLIDALGSDPKKLCIFAQDPEAVRAELAAHGVFCNIHEVTILLKTMLKERQCNSDSPPGPTSDPT